jgi:rod shape-determining protein MreD
MRAAGVLAALAIAVTLQTTLGGLTTTGATLVNLVLVTVVYVALAYGAVTGLLAGTAGGLMQDALAGGIIGSGGLAKTVVGFLVGVLSAQFIVSQALPRFVLFVAASLVHEVVIQALAALVEPHGFTLHVSRVLTQAVANGVVGILAFYVIEQAPGVMQRRQMRRASLGRNRF